MVAERIAEVMQFAVVVTHQVDTLSERVEADDAALVVVGIDNGTKLQKVLDGMRSLRVPYLFVKPGQQFLCRKINLPVTRLLEDR